MKTNNKTMLYEAVSEMIQLHAFDHLLDQELVQFKNVLNQWVSIEHDKDITEKLIPFLSKINFFVETISPASIQLWFCALSYNKISLADMMGTMEQQENNVEVYL